MRTSSRLLACLAVAGAVLTHAGAAAAAAADESAAKRYIASYYSEAGCRAAARDGVRKGHWTNPVCVKTIRFHLGTWDLWVD
ncbi:hypothetical protein [Nonomuraea cavernae]|uniref:Uncharacterized protein n=1 Tax=Nonomuraea cavernae TaxID=2045107 RepID=A0A917ZCJ4_9ACTN|nr:hypothetical protein [Nonomuraea cavernae]MCA2187126.1 hypothetical protein [Nonomuraea cavernae]GGO79197.1 hypothetical protein GCM10012289_62950 [Nonomuraea cavernae]